MARVPPYLRASLRQEPGEVPLEASTVTAGEPTRSAARDSARSTTRFVGEGAGLEPSTIACLNEFIELGATSATGAQRGGPAVPKPTEYAADGRPEHLRHRVHRCRCPTKEEQLRSAAFLCCALGRSAEYQSNALFLGQLGIQGSWAVSATAQRCPRRRFVLTEVTSLQKDLRSKQSEAATAAEDCARLKDALRDLYVKWSVADAVARSSSATVARHVERLQVRCVCMPPDVVAGL